MLYYLKSNGKRTVLGTEADFNRLARYEPGQNPIYAPYIETGFEDIDRPVEAESWKEALKFFEAKGALMGLPRPQVG